MLRVLSVVAVGLVAAVGQADSLTFPVTTASGNAEVSSRLMSGGRSISSVELRLQIPQLEVNATDDGFQSVEARGLNTLSQPGLPNVPTAGSLIAVPAGFEVSLEKVDERQQIVEEVIVEPAQRRFRCGPSHHDGFEFNRGVYEAATTFPESNLRLEEVGVFHGVRLVRVGFYPVRFQPAQRRVIVNPEVLVRVNFAQTGEAAPVEIPLAHYQMLRSSVANGNGLGNLVRPHRGPEVMWIVTADSLKGTITELVEWKRAKGLVVDVTTVTEAGGKKEEIKKFLKKKYDAASVKPTYLLMVGNKDSAPAYKESTGSGAAATDWTYAVLGSDEKIPAVFQGRLLADNEAEAKLQVSRWIAYEKTPAKESWYPQATTIASNEGSNPSDKEYAQQIQAALKAGTYTKFDSFFQADKNATAANIKAAMSEGRTWVSYFGHGSGTSWGSTNDSFGNKQVGELANPGRLPVVIDVACQNGSWINLSKPFAKAWVTHVDGNRDAGAVAFYGGSVNISWHEPAVMSVGVAKNHFEKKITSLGGSVLAGQLYLFEKMGTGNNTFDNLKWYNLFGDPSMTMRTAVPASYELEHEVRPVSGGYEIEVSVTGLRAEGVNVALSAPESGTLSVGSTNTHGSTTLKVSGELPSGAVLTATGYNLETRQITIQ